MFTVLFLFIDGFHTEVIIAADHWRFLQETRGGQPELIEPVRRKWRRWHWLKVASVALAEVTFWSIIL